MSGLSVLYLGSGEFGLPCLERILARPELRLHVVTQPDRPAGRGKKSRPTPVADFLAGKRVAVKKIPNVNDPRAVEELAGVHADLLLVCDFGQILKPSVLGLAKLGPYNIHGSVLPAWRGAAPIQRAILNGDRTTGVTLLRVTERCDAGPIVSTAETPIGPDETFGALRARLAEMAVPLLDAFLDDIGRGHAPALRPQDDARATMAPKIKKEELHLSFDQPAEIVARRVRAFSPEPGAFAFWGNARLKILTVSARPESAGGIPVAGVGRSAAGRFLTIGCSESTLLHVDQIQLEGKRAGPARELLNGHPGLVGSVLT